MLQILCLLAAISLFAQTKAPVVKFYAYVQETSGGNIEVDENGNPLTSGSGTVNSLFAEVTGKSSPSWEKGYTSHGKFVLQAEVIPSGRVNGVKKKSDSKNVLISAKRGATLWKLELVPSKVKTPANIGKLLKKHQVVITTSFRNKQILHVVTKEIVLQPINYE